jgi:hypothetical protein
MKKMQVKFSLTFSFFGSKNLRKKNRLNSLVKFNSFLYFSSKSLKKNACGLTHELGGMRRTNVQLKIPSQKRMLDW